MSSSIGIHGDQRRALGAVIRSAFEGHEPATCVLAICEALADMVEDDRLPDVETACDIIAGMTAQTITDRTYARKYARNLERARAL